MMAKVVLRGMLTAMVGWTALGAQNDQNDVFMETLYRKLNASFAMDQPQGGRATFLILANPGFGVSSEDVRDPYNLSKLLDQIPLPTRLYALSSLTYSNIFHRILTYSQVTSYQDQANKQTTRDAKYLLFDRRRPGKPTAKYATYQTYQAAYDQAVDAKSIAETECRYSGKPVPPQVDQAPQAALAAWERLGGKREVEAAIATLHQAFENNPRVAFQELKSGMGNAMNPDGQSRASDWWPVLASPAIQDWLLDEGWTQWGFRQEDRQHEAPPNQAPAVAGPLQPATPLAAHLRDSLSFSVQLKRVAVTRPWLDANLLASHTWRLMGSAGFARVSTGNLQDPDPGVMPLLVTGLILARNFLMRAKTGHGDGQAHLGQDGLPMAVGPFALGNRARTGGPLRPQVFRSDEELAIRMEGVQIIGFLCEVVPPSPSPDPKYFR